MVRLTRGFGAAPFDPMLVPDHLKVEGGMTSELLRRGLAPTGLRAAPARAPTPPPESGPGEPSSPIAVPPTSERKE